MFVIMLLMTGMKALIPVILGKNFLIFPCTQTSFLSCNVYKDYIYKVNDIGMSYYSIRLMRVSSQNDRKLDVYDRKLGGSHSTQG